MFERYCLLLKTTDKNKAYEISGDDKVMKKVSERLEILSNDDKMIGIYNAEIEEERMRRSLEEEARQEGIKQGIEQEKNAVVKNMLDLGLDIETISKSTKLDINVIKELQ